MGQTCQSRPVGRDGSAEHVSTDNSAAETSPPASPGQGLRCAGCSREGRAPTIAYDKDAELATGPEACIRVVRRPRQGGPALRCLPGEARQVQATAPQGRRQGRAAAVTTKRRKPKIPRDKLFVRFEFWETETPAFEHLSADATRVYLFMLKRFNGSNNGAVAYSHRDAAKVLHSGWRRGSNALAELAHYGFIKQRMAGNPGPGIRPACEWQLTVLPCGGQEASKDFARWSGIVFEPPYRSTATNQIEHHEKQLPVGNMKTPRRQHEDASPRNRILSGRGNGQSVFNMKTPRASRRRQHEDTCRYTTQGSPFGAGSLVVGSDSMVGSKRAKRAQPKTAESPKRPRKVQTTYRGEPTLLVRARDLLRGSPGVMWTRKALMAELDVGAGEAQRLLNKLCARGHAEKVSRGEYRLNSKGA